MPFALSLRPLGALFGFVVLPLCICAGVASSGCSKSNEPKGALEELSPVPAPEGLLAELVISAPEATWLKARGMVGGSAAFLPQSFGGLVATLLKLPITLAPEFDDKVPTLGALVRKGADPLGFTLGLHVKSGSRLLDQLTKGQDSRFTDKLDEASRIHVLSPKEAPSGAASDLALGVLGNYLLVSQRLDALLSTGPYVARTLPTRTAAAAPQEDVVVDVPESSLGGPLLGSLKSVFRDSRVVNLGALPLSSATDTLFAVLSDAKQGRITLELTPSGVRARARLTPKSPDGPATKAIEQMAVGDLKPLAELSQSSLCAMLFREKKETRAAAIPAQADALAGLLGKELSAEEKTTILTALRAEDEARGDWVALGFSLDPKGLGAAVRAPVNDESQMRKALEQLVGLTKLPSIKAKLKEAQITVTSAKTVVENVEGEAARVRFEREGEAAAAKPGKSDKAKSAPIAPSLPSAIELFYLLKKGELFGVVGADPQEGLRSMLKAKEGENLGADPAYAQALTTLGDTVTFALLLDPLRIAEARAGKPGSKTAAPVVIALGREGTPAALFGRVDVATAAVQELSKFAF